MPPVDEHKRHDSYVALEDAIGRENAETLMTMFPPNPWEEIATTSDLALVRSDLKVLRSDLDVLRAEFTTLRHEMRGELHQELRAQTRTLMLGLVGSLATMTSLCLAAVGLAT